MGKQLTLPEGRAWAISHRGRYTDHYTDGTSNHPDISQKQIVSFGVTTLYHLSPDGKEITFFDPWSPVPAKISVPETPNTSFEALNMSVSAATVMLLGYESSPNPEGGIDRVLAIKTKLTDIDVEGWNPALDSAYFPKEVREDDKCVVISWNDWQHHPLPSDAEFTKEIRIVQTGEGNNARELMIKGCQKGVPGIFRKKLDDTQWVFYPDPSLNIPKSAFLKSRIQENKSFQTSVADYKCVSMKWPKSIEKPNEIELQWFGKANPNSTLVFGYGNQGLALFLHRRKTFWHFLGLGKDQYDLVIPGELASHPLINQLFPHHNQVIQGISIKNKNSEELMIRCRHFRLKLKKI
jgi:hypothetical protein